jgi:hypothetical protein
MGLDYSINLYFDASRLEDALLAAAAMAAPLGEPIHVRMPSGRSLTLPFTHDFKTEDCQLRAEGQPLCLDTVLRFPNDGVVGPYFERHHGGADPRRIGPIVEIGYIYLWVHLGHRYSELAFTAATSTMSLLFLESPSIRGQFLNLLHGAGGLAGVFDIETDEFPILSDPDRKIRIDRCAQFEDDREPDGDRSDLNIDGFASALLATYGQALGL